MTTVAGSVLRHDNLEAKFRIRPFITGLRIRIRIIFRSWIRIRTEVKTLIRIKAKFKSFKGSKWNSGRSVDHFIEELDPEPEPH
jgi:hypothetical protein